MATTLSGSTITQSNTDATLSASGLGSITGVTTRTSGNLKIYDLNNLNLTISGTLSFDPRTEKIITTGTVSITGTANVGTTYTSTFGAGTLYSKGDAIVCGNFSNTGTLNLKGATIIITSSSSLLINMSGTIFIRKGKIISTTNNNNNRLRWSTANVDIDGLETTNFQNDMLMTPTASTNILNINPENVGDGIEIALANGGGSSTPLVFSGIPASNGAINAYGSNWQGKNNPELELSEEGSLVNFFPDSCGDSTTSGHGALLFHKFKAIIKSSTGVAIPNAIVYLKDTNNGLRKIKNIANNIVIDKTADQILINPTDSTGRTGTISILTAHIYRNNTVGDISAPDGNEIFDLRSKTNTRGVDDYDIYALAYGYLITRIPTIMKGLSTTIVDNGLLLDTNVTLTEANAIVKLASSFVVNTANNTITVTANSTLDDLYDVMKVYKTRNVQAQLEYPTIDTQPVVANGDTLITSMQIIGFELLTAGVKFKKIQANGVANGVISNIEIIGNVIQDTPTNLINVKINGKLTYNTNTNATITITHTYIRTIENLGTGIITINKVNSSIDDYVDAEINFIDSTISVIGADTITIHPTALDRDLNENISETFTTSFNFKYGSVVNGTTMSTKLYLRCVAGGTPFNFDKTIIKGDNVVNLGIVAQLSSLTSKIELTATTEQLRKVNENVIDAGVLIPASKRF